MDDIKKVVVCPSSTCGRKFAVTAASGWPVVKCPKYKSRVESPFSKEEASEAEIRKEKARRQQAHREAEDARRSDFRRAVGGPRRKVIVKQPVSAYLDECLSSGLQDLPEERNAYRMPDVQPAHILGSGGGTPEHVRLGRDLVNKYPDLDMPYYWLSHHYLLKRDLDTARQLLDQGIRSCKRKRWLCDEYGELEYRAGNLPEAVKWWTRHAVLQITSATFDAYACFMYLGYVAGWCDLPDEARLLFSVTDAIKFIRLDNTGQRELDLMVRSADTAPVTHVRA